MDIVKVKMKDLNARSEEAAFRTICGTARQMGIEISEPGTSTPGLHGLAEQVGKNTGILSWIAPSRSQRNSCCNYRRSR